MTDPRLKLGFLASGNGSSARVIIGACARGELAAEPRLMISNNRSAAALDFAREHGLAAVCIPTQADPATADARLADTLAEHGVELVVMSGYLRQLGPRTIGRYRRRILNIHPGPLPAFGGEGMYGRRVHEAVVAAGASESAVTIHWVDEEYDRGPTLAVHPVPLQPGDSADTLEARVREAEPRFFLATLQRIVSGELPLP